MGMRQWGGEGRKGVFDSCSALVSVPIVIVREGRDRGQRNRWNEDQHFAVDK